MVQKQPETIEEIYQAYIKKMRRHGRIMLGVNLAAIVLSIIALVLAFST